MPFSVLKQMLLKHITPYLTAIKKIPYFQKLGISFLRQNKSHHANTYKCNTSTALIAHTLFSASKLWWGGEKTESERAKESSSSEPLMTRAKHVEGKSPNSVYSFSIPWQTAKLNISAG